jgi:hypothetical protein
LFSPRIHKESFGGFVGFQRLAIDANQKGPLPNFLLPVRVRPVAEIGTSSAVEVFGVMID